MYLFKIIFAGYVNTFIQFIFNCLLKQFAPQIYQKLAEANNESKPPLVSEPPKATHTSNILIQNAEQMANIKFDLAVL